MAVEELPEEAPKGKKKLLFIVIAAVLLLGGGGAAFFFMGSDDSANTEQVSAEDSAPATNPVSYVNIAQPFVFNVTGDTRNRVVQIKVQLMVRGSENHQLHFNLHKNISGSGGRNIVWGGSVSLLAVRR